MSAPALAKPTGITLPDHNQHLHDEANEYFDAHKFLQEKYRRRTGADLRNELKVAIDWHDLGKNHSDWQDACQKDYAIYEATNRKKTGNYLRNTGIRHEMHSLFLAKKCNTFLNDPVRVAIAAHHRKLSFKSQERWEMDDKGNFKQIWKELLALKGTIDFSAFDEAINERYRYSGVRALLQMFDHRASAGESYEELPAFRPFTYDFPYAEPRGVQKTVQELFAKPVGILRAPTGSGKTDAALLWAKHQIAQGRADRLVIAMPTRFTASSLAIANTKSLGSTGLYHSSAWIQREGKTKLDKKEHELARYLETPVTVTTIDHLCICLTGRREDHHAIFWGLANSCVVIDESDFYDPFTQANIIVLLRALRLLEVPVLVMSATVPDSFRLLYSRAGFPIDIISEDKTDADKPRCIVKRHEGLVDKPEEIAALIGTPEDTEKSPLIIYANTVDRAQSYYSYLCRHGFEDVVLYHSRFTEDDKANIEKKLLDILGKEAWQQNTQRGIAVLTQIGELSVNISADRMISDLAPLDRLVQRIGRLSRFGDTVGTITIIEPAKKGAPYPAPYGEYRSGHGWEAAPALTETSNLLQPKEYTRRELVELVDRLYPTLPPETERVKNNRQKLKDNAVDNWLIVPMRQMAMDADEDEEWSSRDIGPQRTVYAKWDDVDALDAFDLKDSFRTWGAFYEHAQPRAINIPIYIFNNALTNQWLQEQVIMIGDENSSRKLDETKIYTVVPEHYHEHKGLAFPGLED